MEIVRFNEKAEEILKSFKDRTKALACSLIGKNGFIITTDKESFLDTDKYEKEIIGFYSSLEWLFEKECGLIDLENKSWSISVGFEISNEEYMILVKQLSKNFAFITILPK